MVDRVAAPYAEFVITEDEDGIKHAISHEIQLSILPDGDTRIVHEREVQPEKGPEHNTSVLKGRLDDVWIYIIGGHVVVSKQKLHINDLAER